MDAYVSKRQIRSTGKKLFANNMIYSDEDKETVISIIAGIIQKFDNAADTIAGLPTIVELKEGNFIPDVIDNIYILNVKSVFIAINSKMFEIEDKEKQTYVNKQLKELKGHGYKIIVILNKNDRVFTMAEQIADMIMFDVNGIPDALVTSNHSFTCKKIATGVNSAENYALASAAGVDYYEGNYIDEEDRIELPKNTHSQASFILIIREINNEKSTSKTVANVISRDAILSAQVIRMANSTYYGTLYRIDSVDVAVTRIGLADLKKWIFILQFSRATEASKELLQLSYQRALLGEMIVKDMKSREIKAMDAYMIGLFSALDALTGKPIDNEIMSMNLTEVVSDALIYRDGIGGELINMIKAYEEGHWQRVDKYIGKFRLTKDKLYKYYFKANEEAAELWTRVAEMKADEAI
jgi:EAL and modified HD-GYP domain-containing signal transduction protein